MQKVKDSIFPAIAWLIISTILLTLPGSSFPKENWLDRIWFDKWVHIAMFFIMVALWCRGVLKFIPGNKKLKQVFLLLALLSLAYGIAMEYVQLYFIKYRSFDTGDIIADAVGCGMGVIYSLGRYIKK